MSDPFAALHEDLFNSPLCEDIFLRGQALRGFVDRNVEMLGDYGQVVGRRTLVELPSASAPQKDDAVIIAGVPYVLDALSADDGHVSRWIVRLET